MRFETVENRTPFVHTVFEKAGPTGQRYDVLLVKATCALRTSAIRAGREDGIALLSEAAPIHPADTHFGEPERSSVQHAGDLVLFKPGTDVLITGTARPPTPTAKRWPAQIELHDPKDSKRHWRRQLRLLAPRHWQWTLLKGWHLSEPEAVESVPLRYELAFGGGYAHKDKWIAHAANPVGVGFPGPEHMDRAQRYPAPQIEVYDHHSTLKPGGILPVPALGPIPRTWAARAQYAGTWNEPFDAERTSGGRSYPPDFDPRFFHAAHPDAIFSRPLRGDERLGLHGLQGEDQRCVGRLPRYTVEAQVIVASGAATVAPLQLDTLEIDLDTQRLYLSWRLPVPHILDARTAALRLKAL